MKKISSEIGFRFENQMPQLYKYNFIYKPICFGLDLYVLVYKVQTYFSVQAIY